MFFKDYPLALRTAIDLRHCTLKEIQGDLDPDPDKAYRVEKDIVAFYGLIATLNHRCPSPYHTVSLRDAEIIAEVDQLLTPTLRRLVNYLTVVCIRECRHYKHFPVDGASDKWNEAVSGVKGSDGTSCVGACYAEADLNTMPLGEILEGASACFGSGGWGGAFGGKAWKTISDHTLKFVSGEISAEVFIDQAFSLQHNTSTVFNKAVIYRHATQDLVHNLLELQAHGYLGVAVKKHAESPVHSLIKAVHPDFLTPDLSAVPEEVTYTVSVYSKVNNTTLKPADASTKLLWTSLSPASKVDEQFFVFLSSKVKYHEKDRGDAGQGVKIPTLKSIEVATS